VELSTTQIYTQVSIRRLKTCTRSRTRARRFEKPTTSTTPTRSTSDVGVEGIPSLAADDTKPLLDTKASKTSPPSWTGT